MTTADTMETERRSASARPGCVSIERVTVVFIESGAQQIAGLIEGV